MRFSCSKRLAALCLTLLVTACAFQRAEDADRAKTRMIGMTKEEVLSCMGPPKHRAQEGDTLVWSYYSTDEFGSTGKYTNSGYTYGAHSKSFCNVSVVMKKDIVTRINYTGPSGSLFAEDEQCGYAVKNCVN